MLIRAFLKYGTSAGGEMNTGGTMVMLPIYSSGRPNAPTHLPFIHISELLLALNEYFDFSGC